MKKILSIILLGISMLGISFYYQGNNVEAESVSNNSTEAVHNPFVNLNAEVSNGTPNKIYYVYYDTNMDSNDFKKVLDSSIKGYKEIGKNFEITSSKDFANIIISDKGIGQITTDKQLLTIGADKYDPNGIFNLLDSNKGYLISSQININSGIENNNTELQSTLTHEIGHAIGFTDN